MKIAMIGSGAAGSVFAAYLKRGGADMYLVDMYKAHMDKIAAEGLRFRLNCEEELLTGFTCCVLLRTGIRIPAKNVKRLISVRGAAGTGGHGPGP